MVSSLMSPPWLCLGLISLISISVLVNSSIANTERQVYIVYMGEKPSGEILIESLNFNLLDQVLDGITSRESIVHSYGRSFSGFAAKLTEQERRKLEGFQNTKEHWQQKLESDVIIGMIDTGIWPESKSFSDEGFGPPPKRWKGTCAKNFSCNNKIIGAKYYFSEAKDNLSPRDVLGHGTHTASIAAGGCVANVSLFGLAQGNARGGVPGARLAVYSVCHRYRGCQEVDILKAFDEAIADGVDIISISMGNDHPSEYFIDVIAIGSFHAMKNGILTVASAGNDGPTPGSVTNVAPWLISVAASSIDRRIIDKLVIGDNRTFEASELMLNLYDYTRTNFEGKGSIILCYGDDGGNSALVYKAEGAVMIDESALDFGKQYPLPALDVSVAVGEELLNYINKTRNPVVNIHKSEEIFDENAPVVASFSSRGPNTITPEILKPDISAPGVNIIAAWSPNASVSDSPVDKRSVFYNILSGTSIACPHVSAVAAYVKSIHPSWSSAAILSALVTTATPMNESRHYVAELAYGAGQLNPARAANPGLVYDAIEADYVKMLCNQGYNSTKLKILTGDKTSICSSKNGTGTVRDLNYPSLTLHAGEGKSVNANFSRTVTNVGIAESVYKAEIRTTSKLEVTVNPSVLSFKSLNQKIEFIVTVSGPPMSSPSMVSASLVWSDGKHDVRSPIFVFV
ncbi:hypothetical protein J5N97_027384 [Dioscorea zingiberensis]|uniref:Cucumisin n=1 Tax=Dioscorea zingiberensis TaxID=325984 RepID=A0A9D5C4A9_9LILI|nr:hypothetical protein J5N97_027384 [Dioscorea zingiberensis]